MLYVDIPTESEIIALASSRDDLSVSIYLPTTPLSQEAASDSVQLKNLAKESLRKLTEKEADKGRVAALSEHFDALIDDPEFWRFQANSLAVLATPDNIQTFRVASVLSPIAVVSDRFFLKPLLRAVSFSNSCYVLALAEGAVRLIEVSADLPASALKVDSLPRDARNVTGRSLLINRSMGRVQGGEGQKVLLEQYARRVNAALRDVLAGSDLPLVLASNEPLASIYRSVNSYPHLARETLYGGSDRLTDAELAASARPVLDRLYRDEITELSAMFATRESQGRATTDIAQAARAATIGAIDTMLVDIDEDVIGTVDDVDGSIAFGDGEEQSSYGIVDEIARRVIMTRGRVLGVRKDDIPEGKLLAAILRYAV